ncbi:MAG: hypothetical protein QOE70_4357 [Chthoniobacter sp.]|jgi:hypothetical protein|nr:hypothetical protein [Chthoniobacter sp.]
MYETFRSHGPDRSAEALRPFMDVQRAHDLFHAIRMGTVPSDFLSAESRLALFAALDVLCWVLKHAHSTAFTTNLEAIERLLEERGYQMRKEGPAG